MSRGAVGSSFLTFHRPAWQEQLPKGLRLAAEWQFGTLLLVALVQLLKDEFAGAFFFVMMSVFFFTFLAAWREDRHIKSPYVWWLVVGLLSAMSAVTVVGLILGVS
jgi:hypothetical protein